MIDLHCHLLPGIDDGASDLETSLEMARMAVADGVDTTACTPHMMPGYFPNTAPQIRDAVRALQAAIDEAAVGLQLVTGADVHLVPGMVKGLREGRLMSLADSRYFLFEPPHTIAPPRLAETIFEILAGGYVPIVTHPERLAWIESHYEIMRAAVDAGAWMQITAGALTGRFGRRPQYWAERMLDEGLVHVLASDAHNLQRRPPVLSPARERVVERLGVQAARDMVVTRPQGVLDNVDPASLPAPEGRAPFRANPFQRLFAPLKRDAR